MAAVAVKALRAICVALALLFIVAFITVYVPAFRSGARIVGSVYDIIPLFATFFAVFLPASFTLKRGRWREYTMMLASFGWAISMLVWIVSIFSWYLTNGFSARVIVREGFPGNVLNCLAILLFAANGLLSLKSIRKRT